MKRSTTKRRSTRKGSGRKVSRRKASAPGPRYVKERGIYRPPEYANIVAPSKLQSGLKQARAEIQNMLDSMFLDGDTFEVDQVSLSVGFDAKGEFLGFGIGGEASMTITIKPKRTP